MLGIYLKLQKIHLLKWLNNSPFTVINDFEQIENVFSPGQIAELNTHKSY